MIYWLVLIALISMTLGINHSQITRARRQCNEEGHLWAKSHFEDATVYVCTRCHLEF